MLAKLTISMFLGVGVMLALMLVFADADASAKPASKRQSMRVFVADEIIDAHARVVVEDGRAFALLPGVDGTPIRIHIRGGRRLLARGLIEPGGKVFVSTRRGKSGRQEYFGHVTLQK